MQPFRMVPMWRCRNLLVCLLLLLIGGQTLARAEGARELLKASFTAAEADPEAVLAPGLQRAFVDTRIESRHRLVVFLHGAGVSENCGPSAHLKRLANYGFHVFSPCYVSGYGVENCGADIAGCRLEAFDGENRHAAVDIGPADSIDRRVSNGLRHLEQIQPGVGWIGFLDTDGNPEWDEIVLTGHSHGASTAALIGKMQPVHRIVMLAGPYDAGQAWLDLPTATAPDRLFALSHRDDKQHAGHLAAYEALQLPGDAVDVDKTSPPYRDSHQLVTSVASGKPHSSVHAGRKSPMSGDRYVLDSVWRYLYGVGEN